MGYRIYIRDNLRNRVAELDDYKQLQMVLKFNAPGTFQFQTDLTASSEKTNLLTLPGYGIIIVKDGVTVLSGPILSLNRVWNKDTNTLIVSGQDDLYWLAIRLAYPVPGGNFSTSAYDSRTGAAETIIRQYVTNNIGSSALSQRRVTNLTLAADQGRGSVVSGNARFDILLELLQSLAKAGGDLGFRIVQSGTSLEFQVYQPSNKTNTVIFSPDLGNLIGFDYKVEQPQSNYVICGGGGEGTARVIVERGDSESIVDFGRVESFVDARDTSDTTELNQRIDEELSTMKSQTGLSLTPIDIPGTTFLTDYNLGDKVSVIIGQYYQEDISEATNAFVQPSQLVPIIVKRNYNTMTIDATIQDVIREVSITVDNETGTTVTPLVGPPDTSNGINLFKVIRNNIARIGKMERR